MQSRDPPTDLVESLYEVSVKPERLYDLIDVWNARLDAAALDTEAEAEVQSRSYGDAAFVRHVERALEILDELTTFEFGRLDDLLAGMPTASAILTDTGIVVAANEPAQALFGLFPGGGLQTMPIVAPELADFRQRLAAVALGPAPKDDVLQLHVRGRERPVLVLLRAIASGRRQRNALLVSADHIWRDAAGAVLARVFGLTAAEIGLARQLAAGDTVQEIAQRKAGSEGTTRSQLHSILGKTGTRNQGELVRLVNMLLQAVALDLGRVQRIRHREALVGDRGPRHLRLADGRRLATLEYGDPSGRPLLWLQSAIGLFQPTAAGEHELRRRGLRLVVAFRAGYGIADPAPPERDILDSAAADLGEAMAILALGRCPVVATVYDIRIALLLAHAAPERVERIVGVACMFPVASIAQFRRLPTIARFYTAVVRYAPHLLPFVLRAWHADIRRSGLQAAVRQIYAQIPADALAFADPEIAEAMLTAYGLVNPTTPAAQATFCAEAVRYQTPWPPGLGDVACPVTLIHGADDGVGACATALDVLALHPAWRFIGVPGEGQLVAFRQWSTVLDAIEATAPPAAIGLPAVTGPATTT